MQDRAGNMGNLFIMPAVGVATGQGPQVQPGLLFLTLPVMTTPVCSAEIVSVQRKGGGETTKVLKEMMRMKELLKFVEEEKNGEEPCKVMLYESLPLSLTGLHHTGVPE